MHRSFSALAFVFFSGILLFGQGMGKKPVVDGQIVYEIKGDKLKIKAQCENKSDKTLALTYKLSIAQIDGSNNSVSNSQGGKKELAPMESKTLSSSSLSWHEGSHVKITLDIYHKKKLLDSETLELPVVEDKEK